MMIYVLILSDLRELYMQQNHVYFVLPRFGLNQGNNETVHCSAFIVDKRQNDEN